MKRHIYLSLIPESLIVSMLPPEEFGNYYAVGSRKRTRGQAIFFEVDPVLLGSAMPGSGLEERCVPHADGTPKRSVYLSVYRVLEQVPLEALKRLYLVTDDGRVLGIDPAAYHPDPAEGLHLYQEICPLTVRVASRLDPVEFGSFITDRSQPISVPKIVFCDLILRQLRTNLESREIGELPYRNIGHLRDCLRELSDQAGKRSKTVERMMRQELLYRTLKSGFFVAEGSRMLFFPMPPKDQLEREYYEWWRSAQNTMSE